MDNIDNLFHNVSTDLGYALGRGDTPAAAAHYGTLLGITLATLPEDERPSLYGAVYDVNKSDPEELGNAAAHITRMFWAAFDN